MASGEDTHSVGCVKRIPENLLGFVQSQIVHYVGRAKDFSAEIHETGGQTAKLVFNYGGNTRSSKKSHFIEIFCIKHSIDCLFIDLAMLRYMVSILARRRANASL